MPVIRISERTQERLALHARPFVDTTQDKAINHILDLLDKFDEKTGNNQESNGKSTILKKQNTTKTANQFPAISPPDLTHTKVLGAYINGERVADWNELLREANRQGFEIEGDFESFRTKTFSNVREGEYRWDGYKPVRTGEISVQNRSSNNAWEEARYLAKLYNFKLEVEFEWRDKEGAAHPKERGMMKWPQDGSQI